ncbi:MAG: undecaprenyl-diphosphate phosphatase [Cytophagales bacterium]|nr:undecaprenyl-diphosphate phosphatase [Cytophagales bacterium]
MKEILEAIFLGIVQGLTEFLPVSSSGHIELAKKLIGYTGEENFTFTLIIHGGTVLSTLVIFRKEILQLIKGFFQFRWNPETQYIAKIFLSMIPVFIVGKFFKEEIEGIFIGNILMVGVALLVTGGLLSFTYFSRPKSKSLGYREAFIIGLSQALAVVPGISRSGSTIATSILLGVNKEESAKFSFLMVLLPIIGANLLDIMEQSSSVGSHGASTAVLGTGFFVSFITGIFACKWMINIVKNSKLIYFAVYCFIVGLIAIGSAVYYGF